MTDRKQSGPDEGYSESKTADISRSLNSLGLISREWNHFIGLTGTRFPWKEVKVLIDC
jgi:hypothetical protein